MARIDTSTLNRENLTGLAQILWNTVEQLASELKEANDLLALARHREEWQHHRTQPEHSLTN